MAKADTSVKWFRSEMADAPVLCGQAGKLIELLDACLINGFSPRTPDSIVVADGVATVTISAGNPYEKHAVVEISGASDQSVNAEWRIASSAASSFTFACPGIANGTITGATVKRAGAGWGKPFSGSAVAVYQSLDPTSTQLYLRVNDQDARYARVRGYENMVDETTSNSTGPFPLLTTLGDTSYTWAKSTTTGTTARQWMLIGDGRIFYFLPRIVESTSTWYAHCMFGDINSLFPGDRYNCVINAWSTASPTNSAEATVALGYSVSSGFGYAARSTTQTGSPLILGASSVSLGSTSGVTGPLNDEISIRNVMMGSVIARDGIAAASPLRGILPGVLACAQSKPMTHGAIIESAPKPVLLVATPSNQAEGRTGFEIVGPWR